jgi:CheY-like chemotaxis protein
VASSVQSNELVSTQNISEESALSFFDLLKKRFGNQPTVQESHVGDDDRRRRSRTEVKPGTKVVIIDDSQTVVAALSRLLRQNNFTTFEAFDAESGLELITQQMPDLVFLDIVLPGMSGFDALRKIRREPSTRNMPVIMISGNEQATEQFYVQRIGANDFMKKPFSRAEVFSRVERVLGISSLELSDDLPDAPISDIPNPNRPQQ